MRIDTGWPGFARALAARRRLLLALLAGTLLGACRHDCGGACGSSTLQFDAFGEREKARRPPKPASVRRFQQPAIPLGLNLSGVNYFATSLPFVDIMKMSDPFISTNVPGEVNVWDTGVADKIPRDKDGYPLELPFAVPGTRAPQILRASVAPALYGGRYTLLYEGDGDFEFPASPVSVVSRAPGRLTLDIPAHSERSIFLAITRSARANHVRNVRLLLPGYAEPHAAQIFHPTFLSRLSGVSTLRFMDWGATNNSPVQHWLERATPSMSQGTRRGVALETMIDLANRAGTDAWFCVPHKADDRYIEEMAKLIKARLDPKHRVYIEYSNELWNGIFEQTGWSANKGCAAGLNKLGAYAGSCQESGPRYWAGIKWQARRSGQVFRSFERVFGGESQRLVRVLAGQAQNLHLNEKLLESFLDPAINNARGAADVLAIAPYVGGQIASDMTEAGQAPGASANQILERLAQNISKEVRESTAASKKLADQYGLGLVAYEAGQHLVAHGNSANDERFVRTLIDANRQPRMRAIYHAMFDAWYQASGDGLLVLFNLAEAPSKFGAWGLLESQEQAPQSAPKYQAFMERLQALSFAATEKSLKAATNRDAESRRGDNSSDVGATPGMKPQPAPSSPP